MKTRTFSSNEEVDGFLAAITRSADAALVSLAKLQGSQGLRALWELKFLQVGCDPLASEAPLNLIEQLNQTFTYVATARAVKILLRLHPKLAPYTVNLGTAAGFDIESTTGDRLAAEVFAAVNTSNNRKLAKDLARMSECRAQLRYVFFMCPGYAEGRRAEMEGVSGVQVWSVGDAA